MMEATVRQVRPTAEAIDVTSYTTNRGASPFLAQNRAQEQPIDGPDLTNQGLYEFPCFISVSFTLFRRI